jgi:hypothetical protein
MEGFAWNKFTMIPPLKYPFERIIQDVENSGEDVLGLTLF